MDWELGEKADPLAPAYPGIKPEWYFLWEYQLLKEFPPHLFGLEGPQVCLLLIAVVIRHLGHHSLARPARLSRQAVAGF